MTTPPTPDAELPPPLPWLEELPPRQIVAELDRYIVGQAAAKKAIAIAIRNRWRRGQAPEDQVENRRPESQRIAQVELGHLRDIEPELHPERLVQTELAAEVVDVLRARVHRPDQEIDRIPRRGVDQEEIDQDDDEDERDRLQQAPKRVCQQRTTAHRRTFRSQGEK